MADKFSSQETDMNTFFDIVENQKNTIDRNRLLLNNFDARSSQVMRKTMQLIWLCENIGVCSAKLYCYLTLSWDFAIRAYNKYVRR